MTAEAPRARGAPAAARRRSPLDGWSQRFEAGSRPGVVTLRERPFLAQVSLRVAAGAAGEAAREACGEAVGVALPLRSGAAAGGRRRSVLWLGPDEWLLVGGEGEEATLVAALEAAVEGTHASVVDVSANRTALELAGPMARDVLESGCRLDLHPRAFGPGSCAATDVARAQVYLHQLDDTPTYRLLVRGSFAAYLAGWLLDAMQEHTTG